MRRNLGAGVFDAYSPLIRRTLRTKVAGHNSSNLALLGRRWGRQRLRRRRRKMDVRFSITIRCRRPAGEAQPGWRSSPGYYGLITDRDGDTLEQADHRRHAEIENAIRDLGTRWAADAAERTEDTGPRLLYAPRRIYLGDRPGEPGP